MQIADCQRFSQTRACLHSSKGAFGIRVSSFMCLALLLFGSVWLRAAFIECSCFYSSILLPYFSTCVSLHMPNCHTGGQCRCTLRARLLQVAVRLGAGAVSQQHAPGKRGTHHHGTGAARAAVEVTAKFIPRGECTFCDVLYRNVMYDRRARSISS